MKEEIQSFQYVFHLVISLINYEGNCVQMYKFLRLMSTKYMEADFSTAISFWFMHVLKFRCSAKGHKLVNNSAQEQELVGEAFVLWDIKRQ